MTDTTSVDGDNMAPTDSDARDWLVPAVLVGIAVVLFIGIAVIAGVRGSDDESVAGQLEQWSSCLRSEGANVPLVETIRGGGFRITVDGSMIEEGIDVGALRPAMDSCQEQAPEGVRKALTLINGFSDLPLDLFG